MTETTRRMVFLLVEGVAMMSFVSAVEALRALNRLIGQEAWCWDLASLDGGSFVTSSEIAVPTAAVGTLLAGADYLFVCGGLRIQDAVDPRYSSVLRRAAQAGIAIGSLSTGTYLLARAGLLDGYRCTTHWENRAAFQEEFPEIDCTEKIFEIDRGRLTCSGGIAAMDLMLHLIIERHGGEWAHRVANQFHHDRIRDDTHSQTGDRPNRHAGLPRPLRQAIGIMQARAEDTLAMAAVAERIGLSPRQMERLFRQHLQTTPARYYLSIRVNRARELLLYSDKTVLEIAVACGFNSMSRFSYWFRFFHNVQPSQFRKSSTASTLGSMLTSIEK
ncbi:GlxA family transcriptional regulator [Ancylobacter moscoviensis]